MDGACVHLGRPGQPHHCSIYDVRPNICGEFERGSWQCWSAPLCRACRPSFSLTLCKTQKIQKLSPALQPATEQRTMALGAIPAANLQQIAAMLSPAQLIGGTQRVWILLAIAGGIAVSAREQAQPADPSAPPETRRERIHPAIAGPRWIHAATLVAAEEEAGPALLRERHQRVPRVMIEQHEAPGFANQNRPRAWAAKRRSARQDDPWRRPSAVHPPASADAQIRQQLPQPVQRNRRWPRPLAMVRACLSSCEPAARANLWPETAHKHREIACLRRRRFLAENASNAFREARGPAYRIVSERLVIRCWEAARCGTPKARRRQQFAPPPPLGAVGRQRAHGARSESGLAAQVPRRIRSRTRLQLWRVLERRVGSDRRRGPAPAPRLERARDRLLGGQRALSQGLRDPRSRARCCALASKSTPPPASKCASGPKIDTAAKSPKPWASSAKAPCAASRATPTAAHATSTSSPCCATTTSAGPIPNLPLRAPRRLRSRLALTAWPRITAKAPLCPPIDANRQNHSDQGCRTRPHGLCSAALNVPSSSPAQDTALSRL